MLVDARFFKNNTICSWLAVRKHAPARQTRSKPPEFSVRPQATRLDSHFGQMTGTVQDPGHVQGPMKVSIFTSCSPGRAAGSPEKENHNCSRGRIGRAPPSPGRSGLFSVIFCLSSESRDPERVHGDAKPGPHGLDQADTDGPFQASSGRR